jgi:hypothetical protein
MLLLPGDLPVFTHIAMQVCAAQDGEGLFETLIIPDKLTSEFRTSLEQELARWPHGGVRLTPLRPLEQWVATRLRNPHTNCWLQMLRGVENTRTRYALWHDADAFLENPHFLKTHYMECKIGGLACLGVSPPWDTWFADQGYGHLVATWELMFDVDWLRTFRPWELRGRKGRLDGHEHIFDISYWAQCLTPPSRITRRVCDGDFVHFNYIISSYRWFQRSIGPFEDGGFCLLLIRLLIDAFDPGNKFPYEVPALHELIAGLHDEGRRVTYRRPGTWSNYPRFRQKFEQLTSNPILTEGQRQLLLEGISFFDEHAKLLRIEASDSQQQSTQLSATL